MPKYVVRVEERTIELHYHYVLVEAASDEEAVEEANDGAIIEQTESWLSTCDTTDRRAEVLPSDSDEWDDLPSNWSI